MNKKIGIVGGGQLGRMLAQSAKKIGFTVVVLDPTPDCPASEFSDIQIVKSFKDAEAIRELARLSDYITFEIESANAEVLAELVAEGHIIHPSPQTLSLIKDKFAQKKFLEKNGISVAPSVQVDTRDEIIAAGKEFGYPLLLKSRFDAYDGRGNALINNEQDIYCALEKLNNGNLYVEKYIPFVKELAVVVARGMSDEMRAYPAVETVQRNNICDVVLAPAPIDLDTAKKAEHLAIDIMHYLKGVGVFAIEMFLLSNGDVSVNEIAPRVHNSGHYTIEAHETSQFEQHVRAVTGMELGSIEMTAPYAVMINILGERTGPAEAIGMEEVLQIPGASIHIYGKVETRPERKMGHITILDSSLESALQKARLARSITSI